MLSRLYQYATILMLVADLEKGIHNTLEAAVYGKPVLFGPYYKKFNEAVGLVETGGGFSISNDQDCTMVIQKFLG